MGRHFGGMCLPVDGQLKHRYHCNGDFLCDAFCRASKDGALCGDSLGRAFGGHCHGEDPGGEHGGFGEFPNAEDLSVA